MPTPPHSPAIWCEDKVKHRPAALYTSIRQNVVELADLHIIEECTIGLGGGMRSLSALPVQCCFHVFCICSFASRYKQPVPELLWPYWAFRRMTAFQHKH